MTDIDLNELAEELADYDTAKKQASRSPREERIIAGFEDIQRFLEEYGRLPRHGDDQDIFERIYAVRLDRLRKLEECRTILEPLDHQGILGAKADSSKNDAEEMDEEELLNELSELDAETAGITELQHVRSSAEKRQAEEVASRQRCSDFDKFKPLFEQVQSELNSGLRETRPFELKADIEVGRFFIVGGQKALLI